MVAIGAGCFYCFRKRAARKLRSHDVEKRSELATTGSQQKHRYEQAASGITAELDSALIPVEAGATATLPRYPEWPRQPHEFSSAEKSAGDFTSSDRHQRPEHFIDSSGRIEQEHSPIGQSKFDTGYS